MINNPLAPMGKAAKEASYILAERSTTQKNALLNDLANAMERAANGICAANAEDVKAGRRAGMSKALLDRLILTPDRLSGIADDVRAVAALADPVGEILDGHQHNQDMNIMRKRVPLGVVAVIYEARPNVTVDVASLCLKTGNAVILRGGKETRKTNEALLNVIHSVLERHQLPKGTVQAIIDPDRSLVNSLLRLDQYVDMLIPRGSNALQQLCKEESRIPVILGGIGVCHILVDENVKTEDALKVIENAKVQRPSVCNALETLLVHKNIASTFIPALAKYLEKSKVVFHATETAMPYFQKHDIEATLAEDHELRQEWLSLDLNVHVIDDVDAGISHIREYGSGHSEAILTEDTAHAYQFTRQVDAAAVYINASTRFTDGGQFGLGTEVAVSTQKLHARGPMGLHALTTYKWLCRGNYSVRS